MHIVNVDSQHVGGTAHVHVHYLHSGSPGTGGRSDTSFLVGGACMA